MRKTVLLLTSVFLVFNSFAISKPSDAVPLKATEIYFPIGQHGERISLSDLSTIKVRDFEKFTGKKMRFFDKIGFKLSQRKLRAAIRPDGTIKNKKMAKAFGDGDGTSGFHIGGFALGLLLGLIGVLIAYLINDDKKRNRVKWAWIGWAAWLVILLLVLVA